MEFSNSSELTSFENETDSVPTAMGGTWNYTNCAPGSFLDRAVIRAPLMVCYAIIFTCCVVGNVILLVVISSQRSMRSSTNFFLANLAVADLMVGVFCVVQNFCHLILFDRARWPLGETMCHLYVFILYFVPSVSAGILVLLSIERYIAVRHPMTAKQVLTKKVLGVLTAGVWVTAVVANIPHYMTANYGGGEFSFCGRDFTTNVNIRDLYTVNFALWYCIPLLTLAVLYLRIGIVLWKSASGFALTGSRPGKSSVRSNCGTPSPFPNNNYKKIIPNRRTPSQHSQYASSPSSGRKAERGRLERATHSMEESVPLRTMETSQDSLKSRRNGPVKLSLDSGLPSRQQRSLRTKVFKRFRSTSTSSATVTSPGGGTDIAESRRKVIRLLVAVILAFAIFTFPNHARLLWQGWSTNIQVCSSSPVMLVQPICFLLLFSNSGINPILYAFLSERFRQAVRDSLQCRKEAYARSRHYLSNCSDFHYPPPQLSRVEEGSWRGRPQDDIQNEKLGPLVSQQPRRMT